jgi:hypothetical protein
VDHRLNVNLGDAVRLVGYNVSSNSLAAGDKLTVTLFWQADNTVAGDDHVFVHLLSDDEQMLAQHDGVPAQGTRPTWSWQPREVLRDEHVLVAESGLPQGVYALSVGMYHYPTMERLPVVGADGERLPEDRVVLQQVQLALAPD